MIQLIYLDVIQIIFDKLDFLSQIRFRQTCKYFYDNLQVVDFYNIDYTFREKLTDKILKNYPDIKYLNASNNSNIKNINNFKNLKVLNCRWNCGISDEDLIGLDLIELNANDNPKIKHINNLKNLKILCCTKNCGISDSDLIGLNLIKLYSCDNQKVTIKL